MSKKQKQRQHQIKKSQSGPRKQAARRAPKTLLASRFEDALKAPRYACFVLPEWQEQSFAFVAFLRERGDGAWLLASYLVDLGCLGVKDVTLTRYLTPAHLDNMLESAAARGTPWERISWDLGAKIVEAGVQWAASLGLPPHPDHALARNIYADAHPESCEIEVICGKDGKPFYMPGPYDDPHPMMDYLTRRLGPDGFHYVLPMG